MDYKKENRLALALSIRGMKQVELCEKTGIFKTSINGYIKQKYQPKQEALYKMAKALDVSEMWLAGYDVPMERTNRDIEHTDIDFTIKKDDTTILIELIKQRKDEIQLNKLFNYILKLQPEQLSTISSIVIQLLKVNGEEDNK